MNVFLNVFFISKNQGLIGYILGRLENVIDRNGGRNQTIAGQFDNFMTAKPQATLRSIAAATGYAKSTVSDALRQNPRIPEATRKAIQKAATEMGYQTDARISMLMAHLRTRHKAGEVNIAWLQYSVDTKPRSKQPWFSGIWEGASRRAKELGFNLDEIILQEKNHTPDRVRRILLSRGIEGVILAPPWYQEAYGAFNWSGLATVVCGSEAQLAPNHFVGPNYRENVALLFENLLRLGYQRPGLWMSEYIDMETRHAVAGTFLVLEQYLPARNRIPWHPKNEIIQAWLKRHRPDVIICQQNEMLEMLEKAGCRVPQDIGVAHLNVCRDVAGWAGIDHNHEVIGQLVLESISSQLNHNERDLPKNPNETLVTGKWVDGRTLAPQKNRI